MRTAHDAVDPADLVGRWNALRRALRGWALEHPHDFALIYGSPVPDYQAPAERTTEPGTAVMALLVTLLEDARRAGRVPGADALGVTPPDATTALGPLLEDPMFDDTGIDPAMLAQGIAAWTLLRGAVTSEVFSQLGPLPDPPALFETLLSASPRLVVTATPAD
ncbi:TetR-like C-terminal domain-containing protein [Terrabacter terrigena]|uniref:TetR-like C-terminal domain-containing protein n=1 Tax=Terrabacter terrigena TaxID=574718 RepID=A0ABW3MZV4_9MICO